MSSPQKRVAKAKCQSGTLIEMFQYDKADVPYVIVQTIPGKHPITKRTTYADETKAVEAYVQFIEELAEGKPVSEYVFASFINEKIHTARNLIVHLRAAGLYP